jgi:hypothetical protein
MGPVLVNPPPKLADVLFAMVLSVTIAVPLFSIPPAFEPA